MKNTIILWMIVTILFISIVTATSTEDESIPTETNLSNDSQSSSLTGYIKNFVSDIIDREISDEVIVVFKDKIDEDVLKQNKAKIKHNFKIIPASFIKAKRKNIDKIKKDSKVRYIEKDQKIKLLQNLKKKINNTKQEIPWGISRVNAPEAWKKTKGKHIKIAILDTGINYNHPDLKNNVKGGISFISKDYDDEDGHGTHVAGVIAAEDNDFGIIGVAPEAELYSVKIINNSYGKLSDAIKGIEWAVENDMDIITMSFGLPEDTRILKDASDEAYIKDIVLVAATGKGQEIYYPAQYGSTIAVSAIDYDNKLVSGSSYGPALELVAPGENIISTGLNNEYSYLTGTSVAAPHVTGIVALLLSNIHSLKPNNIRAKLQRSALDLGEIGRDDYYGYGLASVNLTKEYFSATIAIVFPESIVDQNEKIDLQINPIKVEIVKLENGQENIIHTLFYNGNSGIQYLDIYPGKYKVNQYLENNIFTKEHNITDGDLIIVPLHKVNPQPVHQWIAYQAKNVWSTPEIRSYLAPSWSDNIPYLDNGEILYGVRMEDDEQDSSYFPCWGWLDSPFSGYHPYCNHFWNDPYNSNSPGLHYLGVQWDSSYQRAVDLFSLVLYYYDNGQRNLAYYNLGRIAHLLTDMSVPAHVLDDVHLNTDSYENYMTEYNDDVAGDYNFKQWTGSGSPLSASTLYGLFYNMAEYTDNYDSNDADGEYASHYEGHNDAWETQNGIWSWYDVSYAECVVHGNALMPKAMQNVAGLYKLFWKNVDYDGDGVNNYYDACYQTYGTWCNGCPKPSCPGICEVEYCPSSGAPYCANYGTSTPCAIKDCDDQDDVCIDYHDVYRYCDGAGNCGSGTCDSYDTAPAGWDCGLCKTCNSNGECNSIPPDDSACGTITCSNLDTTCRTYSDLTSNRCAGLGVCRSVDTSNCTVYNDVSAATLCNSVYKCSDSAGGDNAYNSGDHKNPSRGYCDGGGSCDYSLSSPTCTSGEGSGEGFSITSICIDTMSTCRDSCNDNVDNDGDGAVDCYDPDCDCTPAINDSYTYPLTPQYGDTFWIVSDIKDAYDYNVSWCNFTIESPNGTYVVWNENGTFSTSEVLNGVEYCRDGTTCSTVYNGAVDASGYRWNINMSIAAGEVKTQQFAGYAESASVSPNVTAMICADTDNDLVCDDGNDTYETECVITDITTTIAWYSCDYPEPLDVTNDKYILYFNSTGTNPNSTAWLYRTSDPEGYYGTYSDPQPYPYAYDSILVKLKYSDTHWIWNSSNWTINNVQDLGVWKWNVTCLDSQNNKLLGSGNFTISDTTSPSLTIVEPQEITYNYNTSLSLDIIVSDGVGLDSCIYWIDSGNNVTMPSCANTTFNVSEGWHTVNVWANDTSNNANQEDVLFEIDLTEPLFIEVNITDKNGNLVNETNKAIMGRNITFSASIDNYFIDYFNNSLSEENLTFTGDEEIIRYLEIPKSAIVTSAYINLTGYDNSSGYYPTNPWLEVGSIDGSREWINYLYCRDGTNCSSDGDGSVYFNFENFRWNLNATLRSGEILGQGFFGFAGDPNIKPNVTAMICADTDNDLVCDDGNDNYTRSCTINDVTTEAAWWGCYYSTPLNVTNDIYILYYNATGAGSSTIRWLYRTSDPKGYYGNYSDPQPYPNILSYGGLLFMLFYDIKFNWTEQTSDLASTINSYLDTCIPDDNINCTVPLIFHSDTAGKLEYSNIQISYKFDISSAWLVVWETTRAAGNKIGEWFMDLTDNIWTIEIQINESFPFRTNYTIYANDTVNNTAFYDGNFSIYGLYTNLISPINDSIDSDGTITFNCSATSDNNIQNITLYTDINGTWEANQTNDVTGTYNSTTFTIANLEEGSYIWNCLTYDANGNYDYGDDNWTINVNFPPNITDVNITDEQGNEVNDTNKARLYENITFNVSVSPYTEHFIDYFNNSLTTENLTFIGDEEITRYLEIQCESNVTSAYINLSGYCLYKEGEYSGENWTTNVSNNQNSRGIATNNEYIWVVNEDKFVYKFYMNGSYTNDKYNITDPADPTILPFAITTNNTYFWISMGDKNIYKYYMNGTYTNDSFDTSSEISTSTYGITIDNNFIYITDNVNDKVYKYYMNGSYTNDNWNTTPSDFPRGITQDGEYFWITDDGDNKVYKYNYSNKSYIGYNWDTTPSNGPKGIIQNGTYFWIVDFDDLKVYKYYMDRECLTNFWFEIGDIDEEYEWSYRGTKEGEYTGENFDSTGGIQPIQAVTQNGTYFWTSDFVNDQIHRYYINGTYLDSFDLYEDNKNPIGVANNDTSLWVVDEIDLGVYEYYINGTYVDFFILAVGEGNDYPWGITTDNNNLWVTSRNGGEVFKYYMNGSYTGEYINTSDSLNPQPMDITQNGTYFWITDYTYFRSGYDRVYRYHMNGSYVDFFDGPTFFAGSVTTDNNNIWTVDYANWAHKFYMNGTYIDNFAIGTRGSPSPVGITQSETYLWLVDYWFERVYKYNKNGSYTEDSFDLIDENYYPTGIFTNNSYIWITDRIQDKVYRYYMNGTYVDNWSTSPSGSPRGITQDGEYIWITDDSDGIIYKYYINGSYANDNWTPISENDEPWGITQDGEYFWVSDDDVAKVFKYHMNGSYANKTFNTTIDGSIYPIGITQDGEYFWMVTGGNIIYKFYMNEFNRTFKQINQETDNLASAINSYLETAEPLSNGNCTVPFVFHSDTSGELEYSNLRVYYTLSDIDSVWLVIWETVAESGNRLWEGFLDFISGIWTTSVEVNETFAPRTNYTIYANDTVNNTVSYEGNFSVETLPITTLINPGDNSIDTDGDILFNCSATAYYGLSNITLYTNLTGIWSANQTDDLIGAINSTSFTINNIPDSTIFRWNCLTYDANGNYDYGDDNWTINVNFPPNITDVNITDEQGNEVNDTNKARIYENITFNVSMSDTDIDSVWINVWPIQEYLNLVSGIWTISIEINETFEPTTYYTIFANDSVNNIVYYEGNFSIETLPVVTLEDPPDNNVSYTGNVTFNCSARAYYGLSNITLYTDINSTWEANQTNDVTGTYNSTTFTINDIALGTYKWNCLAYDIGSQSGWGDSNYTINVNDIQEPVVNLIFPEDNQNTIGNITFNVSATDDIGLSNCTLYTDINGWAVNDTKAFTGTYDSETWVWEDITMGTYIWNALCYDTSGNSAWSSTNFTFTAYEIGKNKFYIKNSTSSNVAYLDDNGNIILKGNCASGGTCSASDDTFIIKDSGGNEVAHIDQYGNLCIETGDCGDQSASCNPTNDAFIVKNSTGYIVSYIDITGDLCLTSALVEYGTP